MAVAKGDGLDNQVGIVDGSDRDDIDTWIAKLDAVQTSLDRGTYRYQGSWHTKIRVRHRYPRQC